MVELGPWSRMPARYSGQYVGGMKSVSRRAGPVLTVNCGHVCLLAKLNSMQEGSILLSR